MCNIVFGKKLNQKVTQTEQSNKTNKHQESWKLLNEITGRKATKRAILEGQNKEERLETGIVILRRYYVNLQRL